MSESSECKVRSAQTGPHLDEHKKHEMAAWRLSLYQLSDEFALKLWEFRNHSGLPLSSVGPISSSELIFNSSTASANLLLHRKRPFERGNTEESFPNCLQLKACDSRLFAGKGRKTWQVQCQIRQAMRNLGSI